MASYDYPKANEISRVNFNSPPQEYKTSTFPTRLPPNSQNEKEKKPADNRMAIPGLKRKMFSCFSYK